MTIKKKTQARYREDEGRKASEPLHVMLEPEQMKRYQDLKAALNLSMREVVVMAMDAFAASYAKSSTQGTLNADRDVRTGGDHDHQRELTALDRGDAESVRQLALSLARRVTKLETIVDFLQGDMLDQQRFVGREGERLTRIEEEIVLASRDPKHKPTFPRSH